MTVVESLGNYRGPHGQGFGTKPNLFSQNGDEGDATLGLSGHCRDG